MDFAPNANWEAIAFALGWLALSIIALYGIDFVEGKKNKKNAL